MEPEIKSQSVIIRDRAYGSSDAHHLHHRGGDRGSSGAHRLHHRDDDSSDDALKGSDHLRVHDRA